jgi:uncharacterized protein YqeY
MPISALKQRIESDMKSAMRAKDKQRLDIIRLAMSEYKRIEIDERIELDDGRIIGVLDKMTRQRRESVAQYLDANRQDLVDQENYEISVLQEYLPEQLDDAAVDRLLEESIAETGASSMKDMGQLMAALKPKLQGRADMGAISQKVKARLVQSGSN